MIQLTRTYTIETLMEYYRKNYIVAVGLALASFFIFNVLLVVAFFVFRKIRFGNKIILGMIIFLILDILCKCLI